MKIKVTYDKEDILRLIQRDLLANGLKHDLASAVYKGTSTVTIEVEGSPTPDVPTETLEEAPVTTGSKPRIEAPAPQPRVITAPQEVPDEDDGDMRAIIAASDKNAVDKKPMYDPKHLGRP